MDSAPALVTLSLQEVQEALSLRVSSFTNCLRCSLHSILVFGFPVWDRGKVLQRVAFLPTFKPPSLPQSLDYVRQLLYNYVPLPL